MDSLVKQKLEIIQNHLDTYLQTKYPETIYESMRYSMFAGGKRIRAMLLFSVCESLGGNETVALTFACAIEMIHTYSLIHDDLPCMDNDDYRRGKLTNHKVYGEAIALLAGDGLLNLAYETMSEACLHSGSKEALMAMNMIAKAAGVTGMVGGQVVDLLSENKKIDRKELEYIHEHKTGALFYASVMAGAVLANASQADLAHLEMFSHHFGLAFQIKDDILDVIGDSKRMGKSIGSDAKNDKATYTTLVGLEEAQQYHDRLLEDAFVALQSVRAKDTFLYDYACSLANRNV